jgi:hypothetical protein
MKEGAQVISFEGGICRKGQTSVSVAVGRRERERERERERDELKVAPPTGLLAGEVGFRMTSVNVLSKGTFGPEMHLIPQLIRVTN